MASKKVKEFLANKTGGQGSSLSEEFNKLSPDEQDEVIESLKKKQKPKPGPGASEKDAHDNGL